jgi:uroporphyrinogen decarboxylase
VDVQHTLAFGTPEQVRSETLHNRKVFSKGGGYVFNNAHNIQASVSTENMLAMLQSVID